MKITRIPLEEIQSTKKIIEIVLRCARPALISFDLATTPIGTLLFTDLLGFSVGHAPAMEGDV